MIFSSRMKARLTDETLGIVFAGGRSRSPGELPAIRGSIKRYLAVSLQEVISISAIARRTQ